MKRDVQMNEEIDAVLNSIDGINRAEAPPFFYTRLLAKMEEKPQQTTLDKILLLLTRPVMAVSILSVFLTLNIFAIYAMSTSANKSGGVTANTGQKALQNFAVEYNLNTTSVYPNTNN